MRGKNKLPQMEQVVMAIVLDKDKRRERVVVGEKSAVRKLLEGHSDQQVLYDQERPLGTLVYDYESQSKQAWVDGVLSPLFCAMRSKKGREENEQKVWEYAKASITSENPVTIFTAHNLLSLYMTERRITPITANILEARMITLVRTFAGNTWQSDTIGSRLESAKELLQVAKINVDTGTMLWHPWEGCRIMCVISTESVMPQLYVYLEQLCEWGCSMQTCNVCGKPFAALSGHYALCGMDKCKVIQNRLNRKAYGVRAKENQYDQAYANARDGMKKKINKLKKEKDVPRAVIDQAEEWYERFREEAKIRKKKIKKDRREINAFIDWLFEQQRTFDGIVGE